MNQKTQTEKLGKARPERMIVIFVDHLKFFDGLEIVGSARLHNPYLERLVLKLIKYIKREYHFDLFKDVKEIGRQLKAELRKQKRKERL